MIKYKLKKRKPTRVEFTVLAEKILRAATVRDIHMFRRCTSILVSRPSINEDFLR